MADLVTRWVSLHATSWQLKLLTRLVKLPRCLRLRARVASQSPTLHCDARDKYSKCASRGGDDLGSGCGQLARVPPRTISSLCTDGMAMVTLERGLQTGMAGHMGRSKIDRCKGPGPRQSCSSLSRLVEQTRPSASPHSCSWCGFNPARIRNKATLLSPCERRIRDSLRLDATEEARLAACARNKFPIVRAQATIARLQACI